MEEPFEKGQIGSSAMAYKRNPMRSERIASLARYVISASSSPMMTASEQWFERTLDDSANKRISIPEAFRAVVAILGIYANKHMMDELPFMATENIIMYTVKFRGGDRQDLHERIRVYSMEAGSVVKNEGKPNDLLERIAKDPVFGISLEETDKFMDPALYIGRCPEQVTAFLDECVKPLLEKYKDDLNVDAVELKV